MPEGFDAWRVLFLAVPVVAEMRTGYSAALVKALLVKGLLLRPER